VSVKLRSSWSPNLPGSSTDYLRYNTRDYNHLNLFLIFLRNFHNFSIPGRKRELRDERGQVEVSDAILLTVHAGSIDQNLKKRKKYQINKYPINVFRMINWTENIVTNTNPISCLSDIIKITHNKHLSKINFKGYCSNII
jgi:hypothetical protein